MHYSIFLLVIFKCYIIYLFLWTCINIYMFIHIYTALLSMCPFVLLTVLAVIQYFFPYILISILSSLILWISEILVSKCTFIMILYLSFLFNVILKFSLFFLLYLDCELDLFTYIPYLLVTWFDILLVIILQIITWILDLTNLIISRYLSPLLVCLEDTRTLISLIFFSTLSLITLLYTIFII